MIPSVPCFGGSVGKYAAQPGRGADIPGVIGRIPRLKVIHKFHQVPKICTVDINNLYIHIHLYKNHIIIKGSLDEKLPIYEQDPKSKRLDSFEKRFVRD